MSEQRWLELVVEVSRDDAESWADACLDAGALSVQAEDADADSPDEQPQFGEPLPAGAAGGEPGTGPSGVGATATSGMPPPVFGWQRTRLVILVEAATPGADPAAVLTSAAESLGRPQPAVLERRIIEDRDWVRATQAQFDPIPVGERLIIVPSWHVETIAAQQDGRAALIIDPGLAFGTGGHPTTRMCLEWLDQADLAGRRVLDYGCGSGILAIAAARLGAAPVLGVDIDEQALISTRENATINGVSVDVESSSSARPVAADVVVANILSNPLKLLAPMLSRLVAPGGYLVLAGVLDRQAREVADCYDPALQVTVWRSREGWSCLVGQRPR